MASKETRIWRRVNRILLSVLPKTEYDFWFSQIALNKIDSDLVVIGVPNKFITNWLCEHYLGEIKKAFISVLKRNPEIKWAINKPLNPFDPTYSNYKKKYDLYYSKPLKKHFNFNNNSKTETIKKKIIENRLKLPSDLKSYLIKNCHNIKDITFNIDKIKTYNKLNKKDLNIPILKHIINNNIKITINNIQLVISDYFNITISQLIDKNNKGKSFSYPRHLAIYLSKKYTSLSYQEIGFSFGDINLSTVRYAIKKIENLKGKKSSIRSDLINIENLLI